MKPVRRFQDQGGVVLSRTHVSLMGSGSRELGGVRSGDHLGRQRHLVGLLWRRHDFFIYIKNQNSRLGVGVEASTSNCYCRAHCLVMSLQATPAEKGVAEQIRERVTVHDRDGIIRAVTWMQPLLDKWTERLRGYHKIGETAAMPGAKLAALVTRHMKIVFAQHRRVLEDNVDYSVRARDPVAVIPV